MIATMTLGLAEIQTKSNNDLAAGCLGLHACPLAGHLVLAYVEYGHEESQRDDAGDADANVDVEVVEVDCAAGDHDVFGSFLRAER